MRRGLGMRRPPVRQPGLDRNGPAYWPRAGRLMSRLGEKFHLAACFNACNNLIDHGIDKCHLIAYKGYPEGRGLPFVVIINLGYGHVHP